MINPGNPTGENDQVRRLTEQEKRLLSVSRLYIIPSCPSVFIYLLPEKRVLNETNILAIFLFTFGIAIAGVVGIAYIADFDPDRSLYAKILRLSEILIK